MIHVVTAFRRLNTDCGEAVIDVVEQELAKAEQQGGVLEFELTAGVVVAGRQTARSLNTNISFNN